MEPKSNPSAQNPSNPTPQSTQSSLDLQTSSKVSVRTVKKIQDPRYGQVKLCQDEDTGQLYTQAQHLIQAQSMLNDFVNKLKKRREKPNVYFVPFTSYTVENLKNFCSSFYKVNITMPYPSETLQKEVDLRDKSNQHFTSKELTFILYNMIYGLGHMQEMGIGHGKLSPHFLARTTTGYAIMEDPLSQPKTLVPLPKMGDVYWSPEKYQGKAATDPEYSVLKSDVFSAALIVLKLATSRSTRPLYSNGRFVCEYLKDLYLDLKHKYEGNNLLITTIKKMLDVEPKERPSFQEIRTKLPSYHEVKQYFKIIDNNNESYSSGNYQSSSNLINGHEQSSLLQESGWKDVDDYDDLNRQDKLQNEVRAKRVNLPPVQELGDEYKQQKLSTDEANIPPRRLMSSQKQGGTARKLRLNGNTNIDISRSGIELNRESSPNMGPRKESLCRTSPTLLRSPITRKEILEKGSPNKDNSKNERELGPGVVDCPVEDPRNPYHFEYLELKQKRDGVVKNNKFEFNNKSKKIIRDNSLNRQQQQNKKVPQFMMQSQELLQPDIQNLQQQGYQQQQEKPLKKNLTFAHFDKVRTSLSPRNSFSPLIQNTFMKKSSPIQPRKSTNRLSSNSPSYSTSRVVRLVPQNQQNNGQKYQANQMVQQNNQQLQQQPQLKQQPKTTIEINETQYLPKTSQQRDSASPSPSLLKYGQKQVNSQVYQAKSPIQPTILPYIRSSDYQMGRNMETSPVSPSPRTYHTSTIVQKRTPLKSLIEQSKQGGYTSNRMPSIRYTSPKYSPIDQPSNSNKIKYSQLSYLNQNSSRGMESSIKKVNPHINPVYVFED